jgi:dual specificity protein kinase YAK1
MDQWSPYSDAAGNARRYNGPHPSNQPPVSRDYNGISQAQPPAGFNYEQYQSNLTAHSQSIAASPTATPQMRDSNGDIAMSDAGDPYNTMKYPMRPHHQQHLSGSRIATHHSTQEPSAAAQRYSPMEALSPSSPYATSQHGQNQYASPAAAQRQSPTRPGSYSSPNSYYATRQQAQQLPPITPYSSNNDSYPNSATVQLNAVFGNDTKSIRRPGPQLSQGPPGRGPVPEFSKVRTVADLHPKVNAQPAFRRANPEGGFISVSTVLLDREYIC